MPLRLFKIAEEELTNYIREISSGNEDALAQFYKNYGKAILAFILSIVKSHESAEDVLQDVLMAIVTHNTEKSIHNSRAWLFKVIHNISTKKAIEDKAIQTESELLPENESLLYKEDVAQTFENTIEQIEALKYLSQLEQQCVILCIFGHLKLPQVANVMNLPCKKVRSIYYYAVKKLRKYYEERNGFV